MIYKRILNKVDRSFFLFGPRGVGKSTWLKQSYPDSTYVDLLDEGLYQSLLADPSLFYKSLNALSKGSKVIVDEIQRLPHLLNEVHRIIEDRKFQFILSGSSSRKLKKVGTNLLAGRAIKKELLPLMPEELGEDFDLEKVLSFGSMPIIWNAQGDREVIESYVQTYLKEEIQAEALVRNLGGFARFLQIAALFHGQVLNSSSLARDADVARTTILGYLDILEDTLLAFRLPAWEGNLRVKEKTHPKLYWVDPGIVRAAKKRFGVVLEEERGPLFEGWVAGVLRAYQSYHKMFDDWHYWSPTETTSFEVDFLLWKNDECLAIEVKASSRWRKEYEAGLKALAASWKSKVKLRRMAVYLGETRLKTVDGIDILPIKDFLGLIEDGELFSARD